jgi:hypothetical protein
MRTGEEFSGAAHAGLDFIADQQYVAFAADACARGEISGRRHYDATLALNRLDKERRSLRSYRTRKCVGIAERNLSESIWKRPEPVAVLRLGRETDDRDRAPVEIVPANDDFGAVGRDALDLVAPFAGGLQRGLDGLGAAACR